MPGVHVQPQQPRPLPSLGDLTLLKRPADSNEAPPAKRTSYAPPLSDISVPESSSLVATKPQEQLFQPLVQPSGADRMYAQLHQQQTVTPQLGNNFDFLQPLAPNNQDPNFHWNGYTIPRLDQSAPPAAQVAPAPLLPLGDDINLMLPDDLAPDDSVSQMGPELARNAQDQTHALQEFQGLENVMIHGTFAAMPKPSHGLEASHVTQSLWYHMRGFGSNSDKWPKADNIAKMYTSESVPAFRPPKTPVELPLPTKPAQDADALLMRRQRTYAAPAHIVAAFMADLDTSVIIPLKEALQSTSDPRAQQRITQVMEHVQGPASTQLGYALRSLASSFNILASERKTALIALQTPDLQRVLTDEKLGFNRFFAREIGPLTQLAAASAQLRLTQAALSRYPGNNNNSRGGQRNNANSNQKNANQKNSGNNANNNNNNNNNRNQNRGGGGGRRRGNGGGRGQGRGGRGGFNKGAPKPAAKE
jgi:hypothetical protein